MTGIDTAGKIRVGEELDITRLNPWLSAKIQELNGTPQITQYSGGASNWTYCLSYGDKEVILRRAPKGTKAKGAHDMGREFRLQSALKPVYRYVPQMLAHCEDNDVIGSEFYVMEKLTGLIPRNNLPKGVSLSKQQAKTLCTNALDSLINLHQVDVAAAGLGHLGKGEGYTVRQIEGWSTRYRKAKTWNVPKGNYVMDWLKANIPDNENICITHNDFRFDNLVLDIDGMFTRQEVIEYYMDKTGYKTDDFSFYEVYGLFRLAAIVQQIYYRYHHEQTNNPAFKNIWFFVHYLLWRCKRSIKKSKS